MIVTDYDRIFADESLIEKVKAKAKNPLERQGSIRSSTNSIDSIIGGNRLERRGTLTSREERKKNLFDKPAVNKD
jgi:hypothetical protein